MRVFEKKMNDQCENYRPGILFQHYQQQQQQGKQQQEQLTEGSSN